MARDVDPDDERWEVTADHPLYGTEVTLDLERRTVTGRVRDVWKFRGEARTRRRPDPRQRRDREHCSRQVGLLRNFHSKSSARGFKSAPSVPTGKALQVTPHPRLGGRSQEDRWTRSSSPPVLISVTPESDSSVLGDRRGELDYSTPP